MGCEHPVFTFLTSSRAEILVLKQGNAFIRRPSKFSADLGAMMTAWSLRTRERTAWALGRTVLCTQSCLALGPRGLCVTHSNEDREG